MPAFIASRRRAGWIVSLLLALLLGMDELNGATPCPSVGTPSDLVEVKLANPSAVGPAMAIPIAYLSEESLKRIQGQIEGVEVRGISLGLAYPAFEPLVSPTTQSELSGQPMFLSVGAARVPHVRTLWETFFLRLYSTYSGRRFGLYRFLPNPDIPASTVMTSTVYYLPGSPHRAPVIVQCYAGKPSEVNCRLTTESKENIYLELRFLKELLPMWETILDETLEFVKCLIVSDRQ